MAFSTSNQSAGIPSKVYLLRQNGALVGVFSTEDKALVYMRTHRKNSEFWRIEAKEVL